MEFDTANKMSNKQWKCGTTFNLFFFQHKFQQNEYILFYCLGFYYLVGNFLEQNYFKNAFQKLQVFFFGA